MKHKIEFAVFLEIEKILEIKIGKILSVEEVEKSDKLLKLLVSFGGDDERVVVTNIKPHLTTVFEGRQLMLSLNNQNFLFVTNLKPVKMMGIESHAMIMPGELEKKFSIVTVNGEPGNKIL